MWAAKDPLLMAAGDANLYAYCFDVTDVVVISTDDPVNWIDPSGLYTETQEATESRIGEAIDDYNSRSDVGAFAAAAWFHGGQGAYDFGQNMPEVRFSLPWGPVAADEFGNWLAGYATYRRFGPLGTWFTKRAGDWFEGIKNLRKGKWNFHDDEGSLEMINRGVFDAMHGYEPPNQCLQSP
jgi:hypothetical protein